MSWHWSRSHENGWAFLSEASNLKSFYVEPEDGCLIPCSLYERESHLVAEMLRRLMLFLILFKYYIKLHTCFVLLNIRNDVCSTVLVVKVMINIWSFRISLLRILLEL